VRGRLYRRFFGSAGLWLDRKVRALAFTCSEFRWYPLSNWLFSMAFYWTLSFGSFREHDPKNQRSCIATRWSSESQENLKPVRKRLLHGLLLHVVTRGAQQNLPDRPFPLLMPRPPRCIKALPLVPLPILVSRVFILYKTIATTRPRPLHPSELRGRFVVAWVPDKALAVP